MKNLITAFFILTISLVSFNHSRDNYATEISSQSNFATVNSENSTTQPAQSKSDFSNLAKVTSPLKLSAFPLTVTAYGPVNLVVIDDLGDSIGINFNTMISVSYYDNTQDINQDGKNDDLIYITAPAIGRPRIKVIPEDTGYFSLDYQHGENTETILANQVFVSNLKDTLNYRIFFIAESFRGDLNNDYKLNLKDLIFMVNWFFRGGPGPNILLLYQMLIVTWQ